MKKYVCTVCGYIAEGEIPAQCPVCKAPASAFVEKTGNTYVTEHVVGIGKHDALMQRCEVYREIHESQFRKGSDVQ